LGKHQVSDYAVAFNCNHFIACGNKAWLHVDYFVLGFLLGTERENGCFECDCVDQLISPESLKTAMKIAPQIAPPIEGETSDRKLASATIAKARTSKRQKKDLSI